MFVNSTALMLTTDGSWYARMHTLLLEAGFGECRLFPENAAALGEFRRGPVPFVFVCPLAKPRDLDRAFGCVRGHSELLIRFLPIVMLTDRYDKPTIVTFIKRGGDDVVTLPLTAENLIERLKHQIGRPIDYCQTDSYFGPSRRQADASEASEGKRGAGGFLRRFTIVRDMQRGIGIVTTDALLPDERASA